MIEKFTFFWRGPFSQWYPSSFVIKDRTYNCAEQYMMASKALLFNDYVAYVKIMNTDNPKEQKYHGRHVREFNEDVWNKFAQQIVFNGNWAKFTQNKDLRETLLKTKDTTLVEASPYDKIWGIGLSEDNPLAQDRATWRGTNWLGQILTKVREEIKDII